MSRRGLPYSVEPLFGEQDFENLDGGRGDRGAGAEDGGGAVAVQFVVILMGITPPTITMMSSRPSFLSSAMICGTRVRWPAASDETPTTCTSFSTACLAASSGVWNSGPCRRRNRCRHNPCYYLGTRSWPSWPSFAIMTRGWRPSFLANSAHSSLARSNVCRFSLLNYILLILNE